MISDLRLYMGYEVIVNGVMFHHVRNVPINDAQAELEKANAKVLASGTKVWLHNKAGELQPQEYPAGSEYTLGRPRKNIFLDDDPEARGMVGLYFFNPLDAVNRRPLPRIG